MSTGGSKGEEEEEEEERILGRRMALSKNV